MKTKTTKSLTPAVVPTPAAPLPAGGFTLGLDLGDRSHYVCALDATGQILHEGTLVNDRVALALLLTHYPAATVAPFDLHAKLLQLIAREADHAKRGLPARVIAKFNSLVEPELIRALYAASQAGVKIDLIVRGICCLRPGVPGLSENITVRSIIDRFLEHSRIFYFENACQPEVFVGSADWMPRNLFRRIEVVFPIEDGILCDRVINEILRVSLADNARARFLGPDGVYRRAKINDGEKTRRSQTDFMALTTPKAAAKVEEKFPRVELASSPFPKKKKT